MTEQVTINNRNGHALRGVVTRPEGKCQVVVNIHGFGGNKSGYKNMHVRMARHLLKEGIGCVRFDLYGNGESDGEFEDMTFTSLLQDAEDICEWVRDQEWCESLILCGQSMGGYVASTAAPSILPDKLILLCPGAGMWYGALERAVSMEENGVFSADIEGLKFSTEFNKDLHQYEPFKSAKGYDGKVLLVRGTNDELVDEGTCRQYMHVYGDNCRFVSIEGANHNFASISARDEYEKEVIDFLK